MSSQVQGENALHTYSREEISGTVDYINNLVKDDKDLKSIIPINPDGDDIFEAVKSGVLTCKLINKIAPNSISENEIKLKPENHFQMRENHHLALKKAQDSGVIKIVSMGPEDFLEGKLKAHLILGLLWQIVRLDLMNRVSQFGEGEDEEDNAPEEILLRWFNDNLEKAKHPRRINNLANDISDSECYIILLNQLDPKNCSVKALDESDLKQRATLFLQTAEKIGAKKFINVQDIVSGNRRINTAFVANLFAMFHQTPPAPKAETSRPKETSNEVEPGRFEDIESVQQEIDRLKHYLELNAEQAKKEMDRLDQEEEQLRKQQEELEQELNEEKKKTDSIRNQSASQIETLKQKLKELKADNAVSTDELKERIERSQEQNMASVTHQRELELRMAELNQRYMEQQQLRTQWEKRRQDIEKETDNLRERHRKILTKLKVRLEKETALVNTLGDELVSQERELENVERQVFEHEREKISLTRTLNKEISDKEQIKKTKDNIQKQLEEQKKLLSEEKTIQTGEKKKNTELRSKNNRAREIGAQLKAQKNDLVIENKLLDENVEALKDEREDRTIDMIIARGKLDSLENESQELTDELENTSQSKEDEIRRLRAQLKYQQDHVGRVMKKEVRNASVPLKKYEEQINEMSTEIMETDHKKNELSNKKIIVENESKELASQLFDANIKVQDLKQVTKMTEKDLVSTTESLKKEKTAARDEARRAHQEKLNAMKLNRAAQNAKEDAEVLQSEISDLNRERSNLSQDRSNEESVAKSLREKTKSKEQESKLLESEILEEQKSKDAMLSQMNKTHAQEMEKLKTQQIKTKDRKEKQIQEISKDLEEKEQTLEEEKKSARKAQDQLNSTERSVRKLDLASSSLQKTNDESEKARRQLEQEIEMASSFAKQDASKAKKDQQVSSRLKTQLTKNAQTLDEIEKERKSVTDKKRDVEEQMEKAKTQIQNIDLHNSAVEKTSKDLDAQLKELEALSELKSSETKAKQKEKAEQRKSTLKRNAEQDKLKSASSNKSLQSQVDEKEKELEETRKTREAIQNKTLKT